MPRSPRVEFPGAIYHITARGNERREIFRNDPDREMFLKTLGEAVKRFNLKVYAYCLMPNHYHLVVETPEGNLSQSMAWFQSTYTIRFNHKYGRAGHLFQGRYKAHLVEEGMYLRQLICYVHLNPVRPKNKTQAIPVDRWKEMDAYRWSSHRAYRDTKTNDSWLAMDMAKRWRKDSSSYLSNLKTYFGKEMDVLWNSLRGGIALGSESFAENIKKLLEEPVQKADLLSQKEKNDRKQKIEKWLEQEPDKRIRLWLRICLGGEKAADVAREMKYDSGSGVMNSIRRLRKEVLVNDTLKNILLKYENKKG